MRSSTLNRSSLERKLKIYLVITKILQPIRWCSKKLGHGFDYVIRWLYMRYYPLDKLLVDELKKNTFNPDERIKEINWARTNNIVVLLWSSAGTVIALAISILSLAFTILYSMSSLAESKESIVQYIFTKFGYAVVLPSTLSVLLTILITPVLLRKIALTLPSDIFAKLSLANLGQSHVLNFVSLEMWELCREFLASVSIPPKIKACVDLNNDKCDLKSFYEIPLGMRRYEMIKLKNDIINFQSSHYQKQSNCQELKNEATKRLGILPREFGHHILKFSNSIFENKLLTFQSCVEAIIYGFSADDMNAKPMRKSIEGNFKEMCRILDDIENRVLRSLFQIMAYDGIHGSIIGLSSAASTSQSLSIFTRGLSLIAGDMLSNGKLFYDYHYGEFKALLHRSKAHYGFDLLISLENFYNKYYAGTEINMPELLLKVYNNKNIELDVDELNALRRMRFDIVNYHHSAIKMIDKLFRSHLTNKIIESKKRNGKFYIVIFGYSRMVRNVLRTNADIIEDNKIAIFVMKEKSIRMMDTRVLRFELNEKKKKHQVRSTFTATDDFLFSFLKKDDTVMFMGGVEAYDHSNDILLHTNNYQKRVKKMIDKFVSHENRTNPEVLLVAESYKVYNPFPIMDRFGREFFCDHYDKMDIYDFKDMRILPTLITEDISLNKNVQVEIPAT